VEGASTELLVRGADCQTPAAIQAGLHRLLLCLPASVGISASGAGQNFVPTVYFYYRSVVTTRPIAASPGIRGSHLYTVAVGITPGRCLADTVSFKHVVSMVSVVFSKQVSTDSACSGPALSAAVILEQLIAKQGAKDASA